MMTGKQVGTNIISAEDLRDLDRQLFDVFFSQLSPWRLRRREKLEECERGQKVEQ